MAVDVERLVLQLSADIRRMERGLDRARRQTDTATRAIEQRFETMSGRVSRSGAQMAETLRTAIAAVGLTVAAREVAQYADAWTTARNRLAAAGVASGDLAAVQGRLVQLALQTRTDLSATVDLYARLTRSTAQLGATQEEVFRATRILNQAFKAGGASASEQAAAITQLGQALGSGLLQGDELRSLRENAPLLAQAIADEFGVTIAGLKQLGAEGQLTTDRIFAGILNAGAAIESQFAVTQSTVSDTFTNLGTVTTEFVGTLDQAIRGSSVFRDVMGSAERAIRGMTEALREQIALRPGQYLSDLSLRIQSALDRTVPVVGSYKMSRIDNAAQAAAPAWIKETERALVRMQRQAELTGQAQKYRAINNLSDLKRELDAYRQQVEASVAAKTAEQATVGVGRSVWRKLRDEIAFANQELEAMGVFSEVLTRQMARLESTPIAEFLDDAADSAVQLNDALENTSWSRYSTDAEEFTRKIAAMTAAQAALAQQIDRGQQRLSRERERDDGSPDALKKIQAAERALQKLQTQQGSLGVSRAAVQAVVDYARATGDVASAYERMQDVSNLLSADDVQLLNDELRKLASDSISKVGDAFTRLTDTYSRDVEEIDAARRAAIAAGIVDLDRFDRALSESTRKYLEAMDELTDVPNPFADLMEVDVDLPEFEAIGAAFREQMRESLREALRQGITTNDWGDALRSVIATAVTRGFEDAINRFADFLSDILLGQGNSRGLLGSIASGIGGIFSGHRANGGPVNAGGTYRINEAGKGELLYMGRPGQVLTTAQLAKMLPSSSGRSVTISTPVIFNGPVGADLGEVQQLMNQRDQKLMQILPRAIDARVTDSSMRRRYR